MCRVLWVAIQKEKGKPGKRIHTTLLIDALSGPWRLCSRYFWSFGLNRYGFVCSCSQCESEDGEPSELESRKRLRLA